MSKNWVEPERPQMTIRRRVACWIGKATRAQAHKHVMLIAFLRQQWLREHASLLRSTYFSSLLTSRCSFSVLAVCDACDVIRWFCCCNPYRTLTADRTSSCVSYYRVAESPVPPKGPEWYIFNGCWEAVPNSTEKGERLWEFHRSRSLESIDYVARNSSLFVCACECYVGCSKG